jgi:uncharacterized protein (TIGR00297 family)
MGEEMQGVEGDTGWRKAIPEGRDRLQSRVLAGVVGTVLILEMMAVLWQVYFHSGADRPSELALFAKIVGVSIAFSSLVLFLRAATLGGALSGGLICLLLLNGTSSPHHSLAQSGLPPLALLFVLTFLSTRAGRRKKTKAGLAEDRRGRTAAQIIANLAVAALSVSSLGFVLVTRGQVISGDWYYGTWVHPAMMVMCVTALVEATADTVSSEIGQAFGGNPVLIAGLHRVKPGTDGAISVLGTFAGVLAGALIAISGGWAAHLSQKATFVSLVAGLCGFFFDSVLGATVERRGWLGNDLVNFTSTLFAAVSAMVICRILVI